MGKPLKCPDGLLPIPASKFKMGSGSRYYESEGLVHDVRVSAFCMGKHEVTNAGYDLFAAQIRYRLVNVCNPRSIVAVGDDPKTLMANYKSASSSKSCPLVTEKITGVISSDKKLVGYKYGYDEKFADPDQPVVNVNWQNGMDYCAWRYKRGRLPTEAEHERAARGISGDKEYGTSSGTKERLDEEAVTFGDAPMSVCSKPENDLGLCDMAGNVSEWTLDTYVHDYSRLPAGNPVNLSEGRKKVIRGGSWITFTYAGAVSVLHAASRDYKDDDHNSLSIGFRCVVPEDSQE